METLLPCPTLREKRLTDHIDLMVDEFSRIKACHPSNDHAHDLEVKQICERAISNTTQNVPVIEQRDKAQSNLDIANAEIARLTAVEASYLDLEKRFIEKCSEAATERVRLNGDIAALEEALSHYKKKFVGRRTQVGQISHLSEIVCTWALEHKNLGEESPEVVKAAAKLMEWFDQDQLPNHDFFSKESEAALAEMRCAPPVTGIPVSTSRADNACD